VTSLVAVIAPLTGKIIKNGLSVFESGENLLQNEKLSFGENTMSYILEHDAQHPFNIHLKFL